MPRPSTTGMTELETKQEAYRFMVVAFSLALFCVITVATIYCSNLKAKAEATVLPIDAYTIGWQQGYLRAITSVNHAIKEGDVVPLNEFESILAEDIAKFEQLNDLK